jgi:hypothetical protein
VTSDKEQRLAEFSGDYVRNALGIWFFSVLKVKSFIGCLQQSVESLFATAWQAVIWQKALLTGRQLAKKYMSKPSSAKCLT